MLLVGFETAVPASERPQAFTLDCVATGIGLTFNAATNLRTSHIYTMSLAGEFITTLLI